MMYFWFVLLLNSVYQAVRLHCKYGTIAIFKKVSGVFFCFELVKYKGAVQAADVILHVQGGLIYEVHCAVSPVAALFSNRK